MNKQNLGLTALTVALLLGSTSFPAYAEDVSKPPEGGPAMERPDGPAPEGGREGGPGGKFKGGKMFEEADTNKDGALTKEEMLQAHEARVDKMFDKLDGDKNGTLSKDELDKGREEMRKKMREHFKDGRGPGGEHGPGGPGRPDGSGEKSE